MDSFEDLKLSPELVETLAAEGIERPTPLQATVVPVVHRGNNVVVVAGPGAGIAVATVIPLLDRLEGGRDHPVLLLLAPTRDRAGEIAESVGRVAQAAGHRAAATEGAWVLPERASVLASTPADVLAWLRDGRFSLEAVEAVVVDGAATLQAAGDLEALETILEALPAEAQRVLVALPLSDELENLADRHLKRAVHLPPRAVQDGPEAVPHRGTVHARVAEEPKERLLPALCAEILADDARHVVLFVRSEDAAADLGDQLALRGFQSGPPGDGSVPLWLTVDDLEGRAAMDEVQGDVVPVSVDVPADPDALDRRHGGGRGGIVVVEPRELAHLRDVARRTGYTVADREATPPARGGSGLSDLVTALATTLDADSVDVEAYQVVLEPLVRRHGSARVAAACLGLLRARGIPAGAPVPQAGPATGTPRAPSEALPAMVKLFVSLGERDDIRTGDLVGAITGEAGIKGSQVGRIELRDTFSLVEVDADVAERVIRSLNGTTVKGRSVRVDLDRTERERGASGRGRKPGPPQGRRPPAGRGGKPGGGPRRS